MGILKAAAALQVGLCQALLCAGSGAGRSCHLFVMSMLSLTAVLGPSAREELSEGLVWGRSEMGYCMCRCGLEKSRSQFHIVCFLAETWAVGPRKQMYFPFCWSGDFCVDLEMQILQRAHETFPCSLPACWPQAFRICSVMELLGALASPCLQTNKDT